MKTWIISGLGGVVLSFLLTFGTSAQQSEIQGTISSQIEAFKAV